MIIVYQGQEGAYSHLACRHFIPDHQSRAQETFVAAMEAVEKGEADCAMIPVENSTAGRVEEIYRLIPQMQLFIIAEHFEPVNHCLLAPPGTAADSLRRVYSHPQALAQCSQHIRARGLQPEATLDTAGAAQQIMQSREPGSAAIASSLAAELYGLEIIEEQFQDLRGNTTRFIILARDQHELTPLLPAPGEAPWLTSILFKVRNLPAALYKALGGFATNGINLVKLESYMPDGSLNASQFHVDAESHADTPAMLRALEELQFYASEVRLLGTYPAHAWRASRNYHD